MAEMKSKTLQELRDLIEEQNREVAAWGSAQSEEIAKVLFPNIKGMPYC